MTLDLVGITGTNGKTTTAYMIDSAIREAGETAGLLGTVAYRIGDRVAEAVRTTPEASDLQSLLRQMVDAGCRRAVLEVSSHSLALRRVHGLEFAVAVFTNLTRDHLDFHGDMDSYFAAKRILFDSLAPRGRPAGRQRGRRLRRGARPHREPEGLDLLPRARAPTSPPRTCASPWTAPASGPAPRPGPSRCRRRSSVASASATPCAPSGRATPWACPRTRCSGGSRP